MTFAFLGEGRVAYNLGWLAGLRGVASVLPLFALVALLLAPLLFSAPRRRWGLASVALATALIAGAALFPAGGRRAPEMTKFLTRVWEPK